jgi:formate hydrogenlyase subunit 3/multisubunit Na+/H+ antiporter MnhD subunit
MVSSLLGLYYLLEVPTKAFFFAPPEDARHGPGFKEAPLPAVIAMVITAAATVGLFFYPDLAYELMSLVVAGGAE